MDEMRAAKRPLAKIFPFEQLMNVDLESAMEMSGEGVEVQPA
ncbi:MAG: hypothetical protein QXL85_01350 [Candidatus Bathyarchaeia archaeon]